MNIAKKNKS